MELLHKNRELVAWVAIGAVGVVLLNAFVDIAYLNDSWPGDNGPPLSTVARSVVGRFAPVVGLLVAVLATWFVAYWREASKNASLIALVGLCVTGASALLYVVFTLIGWGGDDSNGLRVLSSLLTLVANLAALAIIAGFFFVTWKHVAPAPAAGGYGQPGQQFGQQPGLPQQGAPAPQQPTWQPHEASGGAWNRAGDAATGAGASNWGVPGQQGQGWQPSASPQPSAAEPQPSANPWGQPEPQQQPQQPQQDWNQQSSWAPGPQASPGAADAEEGTVLRPNPGNQWPADPNQQH